MARSLLPGLRSAHDGRQWIWEPVDVGDSRCETGCNAVAAEIARLLDGDRRVIRPRPPAPMLGPFRGTHWQWAYHVIVVKKGLVYDITTGSAGVDVDSYKRLWVYADAIDFGS